MKLKQFRAPYAIAELGQGSVMVGQRLPKGQMVKGVEMTTTGVVISFEEHPSMVISHCGYGFVEDAPKKTEPKPVVKEDDEQTRTVAATPVAKSSMPPPPEPTKEPMLTCKVCKMKLKSKAGLVSHMKGHKAKGWL